MSKDYQIKIGLETHIELDTESKMFSGAENNPFNVEANSNLTPVCIGMPGTLPVPNIEAIKKTVAFGLALNCKILTISKFDRKHYFYPDLPKGYQISQFDQPLCEGGEVIFGEHKVGLTRIHLEEDAGKLLHSKDGTSRVDLNRAGVPLMEIVSEPEITSPAMAREYLKQMQLIARHLNVSQADMEKGQLRCDANVSIIFEDGGKKIASYISEIKNLNSFRVVERALIYEAERIYKELKTDKSTRKRDKKMTVGWDNNKQQTYLQRDKEGSADYRYFPEPDIPPFNPHELVDIEKLKKEVKASLPSNQDSEMQKMGLRVDQIKDILSSKWRAEIWQNYIAIDAKRDKDFHYKVANLLVNDAKTANTAAQLVEVVEVIKKVELSSDSVVILLNELAKNSELEVEEIIEQKKLRQQSDEGELKKVIMKVIETNPEPVKDFKAGKEQSIKFLVGQVMKATKGQANPEVAQKLLRAQLK